MNTSLRLAIAAALAASFSATAEEVPLFDALEVTTTFSPNDINSTTIFDSAETTVYCDGSGTAYLRTVGDTDNYLIVDNYVTLNNFDDVSICQGGNASLGGDSVTGTNCFNTGSTSPTGGAIEDTFTSVATAPIPLSDGVNPLTINLWDWGGVKGNTALELALPENCSSNLEVSMCAGQDNDIGVVSVDQTDTDLLVTFEITQSGWYLGETHVAVGDIPTNKSGNPVPGQFAYECTLATPHETSCTVNVPLSEGPWIPGDSVYIAAHASVNRVDGDGCSSESFWASSVIPEGTNQGTTVIGGDISAVSAGRSNPDGALGAPDAGETGPLPVESFFSLGFDDLDEPRGGTLAVDFDDDVYNGPGNDVCVKEVTLGRPGYPVEKTDVNGYAPNVNAGFVTNKFNSTGLGCVSFPDDTASVTGVELVDRTDPGLFGSRPTADGYDVDAVAACYLLRGDETAWGAACPDDIGTPFSDGKTWATFFEYTIE